MCDWCIPDNCTPHKYNFHCLQVLNPLIWTSIWTWPLCPMSFSVPRCFCTMLYSALDFQSWGIVIVTCFQLVSQPRSAFLRFYWKMGHVPGRCCYAHRLFHSRFFHCPNRLPRFHCRDVTIVFLASLKSNVIPAFLFSFIEILIKLFIWIYKYKIIK